MFGAAPFGVAIAYLTTFTVVVGGVCVLAGWGGILSDRSRDPSIKLPYALYTLTLAVLIQLAYPLLLWNTSYEFLGPQMALFIWPFFSVPSIALYISTWWLARKDSDSASWFLRKSSIALLTIWVLGLVWYVSGAE